MFAKQKVEVFNKIMLSPRQQKGVEILSERLVQDRLFQVNPDEQHHLTRERSRKIGHPVFTEWGTVLPNPDVSLELLGQMMKRHDLVRKLGERTTVDDLQGCWSLPLTAEYDAQKDSRYPQITDKEYGAVRVGAHRLIWRVLIDPAVSPSTHVDHLCRTHACWHPLHLEATSARENLWRGKDAVKRLSGQSPLFEN